VAPSETADYSLLHIEDFPDVLCYNDKKLSPGELVHLSVRPEKIKISFEKPQERPLHNYFHGTVEDVVYKGDHTKYWVKIGGHRVAVTQQHSRFLLDTKPIEWEDEVWLSWHADDGYILERYNACDEKLIEAPSEKVGEEDELHTELQKEQGQA